MLSAVPGPIVVQKFGGSSLADAEAIRAVAARVAAERRRGCAVVVVVSAMGDTTDHLLELARTLSPNPSRRELDLLLASGEQASAALLALAIQALGEPAVALSGEQCGIETNDVHLNARIVAIHPQRVLLELAAGRVVVAAGFQGASGEGELTTLGRGGSDTSAAALAGALGASRCEIFTDVDGVFSADPRRVPQARLLPWLDHGEMQELAWHGAQVLKAEAVEFASDNGIDLRVRSSRSDGAGTLVTDGLPEVAGERGGARWRGETFRPRRPPVAGVAGRRDLMAIVVPGDAGSGPGAVRSVLADLAAYDLIFGSVGPRGLRVYLSDLEIPSPAELVRRLESRFAGRATVTTGLGAASLVGFGLGSRPGSLLEAVEAVEELGVPLIDTFTGRESLSLVVPAPRVDECVAGLHRLYVESAPAAATATRAAGPAGGG